jgi:hypothetical protein
MKYFGMFSTSDIARVLVKISVFGKLQEPDFEKAKNDPLLMHMHQSAATLGPDSDIISAYLVLLHNNVDVLPVVDKHNTLLGVVLASDLRKKMAETLSENGKMPVRQITIASRKIVVHSNRMEQMLSSKGIPPSDAQGPAAKKPGLLSGLFRPKAPAAVPPAAPSKEPVATKKAIAEAKKELMAAKKEAEAKKQEEIAAKNEAAKKHESQQAAANQVQVATKPGFLHGLFGAKKPNAAPSDGSKAAPAPKQAAALPQSRKGQKPSAPSEPDEDLGNGTALDMVLHYVQVKGVATAEEVAARFKIPEPEIEEFAISLEKHGLLKVEFNFMGKMTLKKVE